MTLTTTEHTEKFYPPEKSMSGINTYYHPCEVRGGRPHYGVCLFTIQAYEQNRLNGSMEECAHAIKHKQCAAIDKRQEERNAGRALYYFERQIPTVTVMQTSQYKTISAVDRSSASYLKGFSGESVKRSPTKAIKKYVSTPIPVKKVSEFETGMNSVSSNSSVINEHLKTETKKVESSPVEVVIDESAKRREKARLMAQQLFRKNG